MSKFKKTTKKFGKGLVLCTVLGVATGLVFGITEK